MTCVWIGPRFTDAPPGYPSHTVPKTQVLTRNPSLTKKRDKGAKARNSATVSKVLQWFSTTGKASGSNVKAVRSGLITEGLETDGTISRAKPRYDYMPTAAKRSNAIELSLCILGFLRSWKRIEDRAECRVPSTPVRLFGAQQRSYEGASAID